VKESGSILCIDAIDETRDTGAKEKTKECLRSFDIPCFVTARKSEFADETDGFTTLHLESLSTKKFLESRFGIDEA